MIREFHTRKLAELAGILYARDACISLYMPTDPEAPVKKNKNAFEKALSKAVKKLRKEGGLLNNKFTKKRAQEFLEPAYRLLDKEEFWEGTQNGLSLFISNAHFEAFNTPVSFQHDIYVGREFHLRQMLRVIKGEERFYLLDLSEEHKRLFEGNKHNVYQLPTEEVFPDEREVSSMEEKDLVLHSDYGGTLTSVFIRPGIVTSAGNADRKVYFRQVDDALLDTISDESVPLLLAGTSEQVASYKAISRHPAILEKYIRDPEEDQHVLFEISTSLLEDHFELEKKKRKRSFSHSRKKGKASTKLIELANKAKDGELETLYLDIDVPITWGYFQGRKNPVLKVEDMHNAYNTCLVNFTAMQTWKHGGNVYHLPNEDLPDPESKIQGVFRAA